MLKKQENAARGIVESGIKRRGGPTSISLNGKENLYPN